MQGMDQSNRRFILGQRVEPLQLRAIACPVMVVSSDYDPFFGKDTLREFAKLIGPSGATLVHFPGHGHSVRIVCQ